MMDARTVPTVIAVALACMLLAGCDENLPGKPKPADRPLPAERVLAFDKLFSRNCAGCHGANGINGPAPALNDPLFRALIPLDEIAKVLREGRPGTPMPPFAHASGGPMTAAQVDVLVHEIKGVPYRIDEDQTIVADAKGIAPTWGIPAPPPDNAPPYLLPKASGDAARGAQLFARVCATCHGANGGGALSDGQLKLRINQTAFLALISDQALRRIMITGRADLHMPNYAQAEGRPLDHQPLTSSDIADLNALLATWRQGHAAPTP